MRRAKERAVRVMRIASLVLAGTMVIASTGCSLRYGQFQALEGKHNMAFPNYEMCSDSPKFGEDEIGLKACFARQVMQTRFVMTGPWPLYGGYNVGKETITEFGSEIDNNVVVVVVHKESQGIYFGRILKDVPPQKNVVDGAGTGGELSAVESYFNIDLKAQCKLEPQPGKYWAVVLLGRLASPVLEFEVN
jgi:hypothetical protein